MEARFVFQGLCFRCKAQVVCERRTCGARAWRGELARRTECKGGAASPPACIPPPSPTLGGCIPQIALGCEGSPLNKIKEGSGPGSEIRTLFITYSDDKNRVERKEHLEPALITPCTPVSWMQRSTSLRCWMLPLANTGIFTAFLQQKYTKQLIQYSYSRRRQTFSSSRPKLRRWLTVLP